MGSNLKEYILHLDEMIRRLEFRCTCCGETVTLFGFARPRKVILDGENHRIPLRRVRCKDCKKTHVLLPDFLCPHKHYSVFDIELAIGELESGIPAEEIDCAADVSTIRRWYCSFTSKAARVFGGLQAALQVHFHQVVSELSVAGKTHFQRLAMILEHFPKMETNDFLFSQSNLILSNLAHTHTLRGMTASSVVTLWLNP